MRTIVETIQEIPGDVTVPLKQVLTVLLSFYKFETGRAKYDVAHDIKFIMRRFLEEAQKKGQI